MTRGLSVYLDAVRFAAALVVLISHLAYPRFTGATLDFIRDWDVGREAVVIFFVLSGFVIAFAAERDDSGRKFAFNRATRLYSVMVPALLLTLALDRLGQHISSEDYAGWWYAETSAADTFLRGFTFSNEWMPAPIRLGTNGPLWSISYEAAYYLMFGILIFAPRMIGSAMVLLVALIAGPRVLFLMPAWIFGVLTWQFIRNRRSQLPVAGALALTVLFPLFYAVSYAVGLPDLLNQISTGLSRDAFASVGGLGFSDKFIWHGLIGMVFALHLVGMSQLLANIRTPRAGKLIRWLAGASFTLYVLHYPLLQFVDAVLPAHIVARSVALGAIVIIVCFAVAEVTERRLKPMRTFLQRRVPARSV